MTEIDWEQFSKIAGSVGRSISSAWRVVEPDDVKQAILLHAYERRRMIEDNNTESFLWSFAKKVGQQFASAERDARDVEDGRYYYTPQEVRTALGSFIFTDEELGALMGRQDDLLKCRVDDNLMSARLDASTALARLPKASQELLMRRYVFGIPALDDTERKAINRAADGLARRMNRDLRKDANDFSHRYSGDRIPANVLTS